jgi:hypothetical protein
LRPSSALEQDDLLEEAAVTLERGAEMVELRPRHQWEQISERMMAKVIRLCLKRWPVFATGRDLVCHDAVGDGITASEIFDEIRARAHGALALCPMCVRVT